MIALLRGILFAALSLWVIGAPAQPVQTLQVNFFREDPATAVGRAKGFFERSGLEVKVIRNANSTEQMRGLVDGTYQVASTAFDNLLGWSGRDGAELIAISQVIDTAVFPVIVRPEIKKWSDLRGRKLAVDAVDTAFALVLRRVLLDQGLDFARGDYELVAVGNTPLRLESLKKGETFAALLTAPVDTQALAAGMVKLGDSSRSLPGYPNTIFAASRGWAEKHRTELVSFLRAWLGALGWIRANRGEAIAVVGRELKATPQVATRLIDELTASGALNSSSLKIPLDLRNQFGMTPRIGSDVARYYDTSYYEAAAAK